MTWPASSTVLRPGKRDFHWGVGSSRHGGISGPRKRGAASNYRLTSPGLASISQAAVPIPNVLGVPGKGCSREADLLFPNLLVPPRAVASNERVHRRPDEWCYCFMRQHFSTRFPPASLRGAAATSCFADAMVIALGAWRSSDKAMAASSSQRGRE